MLGNVAGPSARGTSPPLGLCLGVVVSPERAQATLPPPACVSPPRARASFSSFWLPPSPARAGDGRRGVPSFLGLEGRRGAWPARRRWPRRGRRRLWARAWACRRAGAAFLGLRLIKRIQPARRHLAPRPRQLSLPAPPPRAHLSAASSLIFTASSVAQTKVAVVHAMQRTSPHHHRMRPRAPTLSVWHAPRLDGQTGLGFKDIGKEPACKTVLRCARPVRH